MNSKMTKEQADQIVTAIIKDFTDRKGLRQQWDLIDRETQQEIKTTWVKLVMEAAK